MKSTASLIFVLLLAGTAAHIAWFYPLLPETVASHYGISGEPDGWTGKGTFLGVYAAVVAVVAGTVLGFAALISKLPVSLLNIPNRDYWLAPERRRASFATVRASLLWLGNVSLAFMIGTMHLTFRVNLGLQTGLGTAFWLLLGGFVLAMVGMMLWIMTRFGKPRAA